MLYTDIMWVENLVGGSTKMKTSTTGAVAIKTGDPLKECATDDLLIPITAVDDCVVGVALHDSAIGASIKYVPSYPWNVFAIKTTTGCEYDASDDQFNKCDFSVFTSGAMTIAPGTCAGALGDVLLLGLADGEDDDTDLNVALCIFMDTPYTNTAR